MFERSSNPVSTLKFSGEENATGQISMFLMVHGHQYQMPTPDLSPAYRRDMDSSIWGNHGPI